MRPGAMGSDEAGLPRFPPEGGSAADLAPQWEPGLVEVEFREGVQPVVAAAGTASAGPAAPVVSAAGVALDGLHQVLARHQVVKAEKSISVGHEEALAAQATARSKGMDVPHLGNFVRLYFPASADVAAIAAELRDLPEVVRAVPVPQMLPATALMPEAVALRLAGGQVAPPEAEVPPASPLSEPLVGNSDQVVVDPGTGLEHQWYVFRCHVDQAWKRASGRGAVFADIDFGFRTTHQDLAPQLDLGQAYNSVDGSSNVSVGAFVFHGTGVMGIAGAAVNGLGPAGIAYAARFWPIQANTGAGAALPGDPWANAIEHVRQANSGAARKIINLEVQTGNFGNIEQVPSVNAAIRTAIAGGVIVCVAAGNGNKDAGIDDSGHPIPETGSILVGATSYDPAKNPRAWFSNFGPRIVVCAPGDSNHDVTCDSASDSAYRNNFGGTSGATPKVAATVALMLEVNPDLTHAEAAALLRATGGPVVAEAGKPVGTFLNADAAVRQAAASGVGRMEVFARGSDGALWHKWQTAPNNGWSGWASLGGWIDLLTVGRNADGRLEIFARGHDGAVWHIWQTAPNNGWSNWSSLGGWIDLLALGQNADGRLEVFARGSDKAVWHKWQTAPNNGWSGWASLGGWIDLLTLGQNADGRLEIFARGSDGALWHKWQTAPNNGWSNWASLGGWIDLLALGQNADGRLEVFARGSDGALWHKWQTAPNNGWSGWASLGGWIDLLSVGRNADGRLEVFARGADKALWHNWQTAPNNGWSGWASLGGQIDRLTVSRNANGRLEVFARGTDGALWHRWQTAPNNGWSGWASLGGWIDLLAVGANFPAAAAPTAIGPAEATAGNGNTAGLTPRMMTGAPHLPDFAGAQG
jgi:hypothetical protein